MPERVVRVGIIAYGRSGRDIHAAHLKADPRYRVVAVSEVSAERREEARQELGADVYGDYREMLGRKDLDLVINSTPSNLHVPVTLAILESGQNALCEKPLARRAADVDRLIAASKKGMRLLAIYQQSRFAPAFVKIRELIDSGVLGRVVMVKIASNGFGRRWDWQTLQENDGGNLLNTGPHPLDQALVLFGDGMPEVFCRMDRANTFGDAEDHVKLLLTGRGHPAIDVEISSCCAYSLYTYQVFGTRGGLTGKADELTWKHFDPEKAAPRSLIRTPLPGRVYCGEKLPWVEEKWTLPPEQTNLFPTMAEQFYDHLYESLVHDAPLVITPEQVRRQIAVIEECHRQNPLSRLGA